MNMSTVRAPWSFSTLRLLIGAFVCIAVVAGVGERSAEARFSGLVADIPILSRAVDWSDVPVPLANKLQSSLGGRVPAMVLTGAARVDGGAIQAFGTRAILCVASSPEAPVSNVCRPIAAVRAHGLNLATPCRGSRSNKVRVSGIVSVREGEIVLEQAGATARVPASRGAYSFLVDPEDAVLRSARGDVIARLALASNYAAADCFD